MLTRRVFVYNGIINLDMKAWEDTPIVNYKKNNKQWYLKCHHTVTL